MEIQTKFQRYTCTLLTLDTHREFQPPLQPRTQQFRPALHAPIAVYRVCIVSGHRISRIRVVFKNDRLVGRALRALTLYDNSSYFILLVRVRVAHNDVSESIQFVRGRAAHVHCKSFRLQCASWVRSLAPIVVFRYCSLCCHQW